LLAHGLWFSPDTPASSTTKTDRYDIAESGVKHNKSKLNQNLMLLHFNGMSRKKSFKYLFLKLIEPLGPSTLDTVVCLIRFHSHSSKQFTPFKIHSTAQCLKISYSLVIGDVTDMT
jgi:hypothetical protein